MSINSVVISGGLGKDPELRTTQGGTAIMNLSVAVSDRRKSAQGGEWEDTTHWVDVLVFGRRAESLSKILRKGMRVTVSGKLSQSRWEDKQGNKRSKLEVVANDVELPPRNASQGQQQPTQGQQYQQQCDYTNQQRYSPRNGYQQPQNGYQQEDVYDSDIPW